MSLSSFTDLWPVVLGALILVIIGVLVWFVFNKIQSAKPVAVQRRSRLLNSSQRQFFDALVGALGEDYFIFTRVGMRSVVEVDRSATVAQRRRAIQLIDNGYFDYVLCSQANMSIFAVVELQNFDGKSQRSRLRRESLLTQICDNAGIKLFYFDIRQDYRSKDVARLITGRVKKSREDSEVSLTPTHESRLSVDTLSQSVLGHRRTCPKCRSEVVTKVAVRGPQMGKKFLMCRKYPYCDYHMLSTDENIKKMEQEERRKGGVSGFNNWS